MYIREECNYCLSRLTIIKQINITKKLKIDKNEWDERCSQPWYYNGQVNIIMFELIRSKEYSALIDERMMLNIKKNRIKSLVEEVLCNSRSTMLRIIMYRIRHNIQVQEKKARSPISELLSVMVSSFSFPNTSMSWRKISNDRHGNKPSLKLEVMI